MKLSGIYFLFDESGFWPLGRGDDLCTKTAQTYFYGEALQKIAYAPQTVWMIPVEAIKKETV